MTDDDLALLAPLVWSVVVALTALAVGLWLLSV